MKEYLDFAIEIAKYAGKIMKEYFFEKENSIDYKEDKTPVTYADKKINEYLIKKVKQKYPTHGVDGEEAKFLNNNRYIWVCAYSSFFFSIGSRWTASSRSCI